MVDCPADGCDYSGPKSSVLGHYSGKRDDAHTGGYLEAKEMIDGGEMVTESGEDTSQADSEGSTLNIPQPDETTTDGSGSRMSRLRSRAGFRSGV